jgi:radial spoke head protein 3
VIEIELKEPLKQQQQEEKQEEEKQQKEQQEQKETALRRQRLEQRKLDREMALQSSSSRSPEPVQGRSNIQVQTELYLEEITERVAETNVDTQTDALMDRPPSPLFVPQKHGVDAATEILEGDLFNFDVEVEGILQVIVGKTLEQSLLEVMKEEELANIISF